MSPEQHMEPIEIKAFSEFWWSVLAVALVALGFSVYAVTEGLLLGWVGVVAFGAATVLGAKGALDPRPRIVLNEEGVLDRTLWVGVISWDDIATAHVASIGGNSFICLGLKDEDKYVSRLSPFVRSLTRLNEKLGFSRLSINLSGADVDPYKVLAIVLTMSGAKVPPQASRSPRRRKRP